MKNYDVSIIVPIYNVEKFIAKCAITLMEQDYKNIEYIFVNDCTPDNSMQVLSDTLTKYPNRKDDIKIINNAQNSGSSITRKNGLDIANGEYILFIDSDDWVELNMVSSMLKKAKETDTDILVNKNCKKYKNNKSSMIIFLLSGYLNLGLCNKIIKNDLYKKIKFLKFSYGEYLCICLQSFYYANNIQYVNKILCYYNRNNEFSITTNKYNVHKSISQAYELNVKIQNFLKEKSIFEQYIQYNYRRMFLLIISSISKTTPFKNNIKICPQASNIKYILIKKLKQFLYK